MKPVNTNKASKRGEDRAEKELRYIYECPCDHPTHAENPQHHKQSDIGCPSCDHWHDTSYWFNNKEVRTLITTEIIAELERAKYACYEENCWDDLPEERQKGINQIIDHITNKLKAKETQL